MENLMNLIHARPYYKHIQHICRDISKEEVIEMIKKTRTSAKTTKLV